MSIALFFARRIQRARNRKRLKAVEEWIRTLDDQIHSGQVLLDKALQERDKLVAEGYLLEDPVDLIRAAGA